MPGPAEADHGPMLIGTVFNILLFGIMITQVYIYYTSYRSDKIFMKFLVLAVFLVDTINTVFDVTYMYVCLILHFGDADYLTVTNWQFATDPALTGLISLMVQLFFAWRIHVLTKNWFLVTIVVILALASGICAFVTAWEVIVIPQFVRFQEFQGIVIVWLACAAAADITITTILVWHLVSWSGPSTKRKHKTGFRGSDMVIDRIIRLTVQTGLITSVAATVDLAVYLTSSSGTHLLFNFALCKLYSNSLMSSLNSRGRWRNGNSTWENVFSEGCGRSGDRGNPTITWQEQDVKASQQPKEKSIPDSTGTGVFVHVESHEMRDMESRQKDLQGESKMVVIPAGTSYACSNQGNESLEESPV